MINKLWVFASASLMLLASQTALASLVAVPEIDGAGTILALGLTVAVIALIKERRGK